MGRGRKRKARIEKPSGEQDELTPPPQRFPSPDIVHLETDGEVSQYQTEEQVSELLQKAELDLHRYVYRAKNHYVKLQKFEDAHDRLTDEANKYSEEIKELQGLTTSTNEMIDYVESAIPLVKAETAATKKRWMEYERKFWKKKQALEKMSQLFNPGGPALEFHQLDQKLDRITDSKTEDFSEAVNAIFNWIELRKPEFKAKCPPDDFKEPPEYPLWFQSLIWNRSLFQISYSKIKELRDNWKNLTERVKEIENKRTEEEADLEQLVAYGIDQQENCSSVIMHYENIQAEYTEVLEEQRVEREKEINMLNRLKLIEEFTGEANERMDEVNEHDQHRECSICIRIYNDQERVPMVGRCGHTICLECVTQLMRVAGVNEDTKPIATCPTCKQHTTFVKNFSMVPSRSSRK